LFSKQFSFVIWLVTGFQCFPIPCGGGQGGADLIGSPKKMIDEIG